MTNLLKKLILFVGLCSCISLLSVDFVHAQQLKEEHRKVQDAVDFFKTYRKSGVDNAVLPLLADNDDKIETGKIYCGSSDQVCDSETHVCLMCEYDIKLPGQQSVKISQKKGRCVSRSELNENNLRENWPIDEECPRGTIRIEERSWEETSGQRGTVNYNTYHEETFSDGTHNYRLVLQDNKFTIAYNNRKEAAFRGCEVFPVVARKMQGCFYCNLARIVYAAAQKMAASAFSDLAPSLRVVIVVYFAIWLALISANYAFTMTKQDAPKYISSLLQISFKVAVAFFLLAYPNDIFAYFIRPLLTAGLSLGSAIQTFAENAPSELSPGGAELSGNYYGAELFARIEAYLTVIQSQMSYMQALGSTIFCVGSHSITFMGADTLIRLADAIRLMFMGGCIFIFALLMTLAFGFYFIDALIHLIILGAMLPLMIATWPLPFGTTKFAASGFKMLLNVFFTFFMVGFVVSVCWMLIDQCMTIAQPDDVQKGDSEGMLRIIDALYDQNFKALTDAVLIGPKGFLILLFGCLFGFKFIGQAPKLASKLSGDKGSLGLASNVATMGQSAAKGLASKIAKPFADVAAESYHDAGGVIGIAGKTASKTGKIVGGIGSGVSWVSRGVSKIPYVGTALGAAGNFAGKAIKGVGKGVEATGGFVQKAGKKVHSALRK